MTHIVTDTGELVLNRTAYMQYLMNVTYPQVAIKAILMGTLKGAWEEAISERLYTEIYLDQNPMAFELLDLTGDPNYTLDTFKKAAYLVTGSVSKSSQK